PRGATPALGGPRGHARAARHRADAAPADGHAGGAARRAGRLQGPRLPGARRTGAARGALGPSGHRAGRQALVGLIPGAWRERRRRSQAPLIVPARARGARQESTRVSAGATSASRLTGWLTPPPRRARAAAAASDSAVGSGQSTCSRLIP